MKIKEIIVVEGKNDTKKLQSFFDCDTIETHGSCLSDWTLSYIKKAKNSRGVIIFTDPDGPGEKIRSIINEKVNGCKNAFIKKSKAHTSKKVGIEHANKEDLFEALNSLMTYDKNYQEVLSYSDFLELGLNGKVDSKSKRLLVSNHFNLGSCNAKTLYKRLNMFEINKEMIEEIL